MRRLLVTLVWVLCGAPLAQADIIHFKDGRKLEGVIVESTDAAIKVETSFGTIEVERSRISSIEEKLTPAQQLADQRATIPDDDAPALYQLAMWAKEHKLRKEHTALLEEVLTADPGHREANQALGRVEVEGVWMPPEEVEAYMQRVKAEKEAQGLLFHEGQWLQEAEVMAARDFVRYRDEWRPRREAETLLNLEGLSSLVQYDADATAGEFVTLFTHLDVDPVDDLVFNLDAEVRDFLRRLELNPKEVAQVTRFDLPIYVVPDFDTAERMLTGDFIKRYPMAAGVAESFVGKPSFGLHWPRPLLVLVEGPHLDVVQDRQSARLGLLAHQLATLLLERLKGSRDSPGWVRVGLTAFYEGATNYYSTLSLTHDLEAALDEDGAPVVDLWVDGWESYPQWRDNMRDEHKAAGVGSLEPYLRLPWQAMDSRGVGVSWSLCRFLMERHPTEFIDYIRAYDSDRDKAGGDPRRLHEKAWTRAFANTVDEIEREWLRWARAQPENFPVDELERM